MPCAPSLPKTLIYLRQGLVNPLSISRAPGSKRVPEKYLLSDWTFLLCTQIPIHPGCPAALWNLGKAVATCRQG